MAYDIGALVQEGSRDVKVRSRTVTCGDCLEILPALAAESVDVVVTSPPYNLGIAYRSYRDDLPRSEYLDWIARVGVQLARVMKPDASLFINLGSTNSDPWLAMDAADALRETLMLQNHITWIKSISIGDDTIGHFKPISSYRYLNQNHEAIFHFTKSGAVPIDRLAVGVPYKDKTNIGRRGHAQDRRCQGNVWFIPYETVQNKAQKFGHPAGFPVELARRCIKLHGSCEIVLDPFVGAGTTLVAAAELGCSALGIEIDSHYAKVAEDRLAAL